MSTKGNIQNPENTKNEKTKRFIPNLTEGVFSPKYYNSEIPIVSSFTVQDTANFLKNLIHS